MIGLTRPRYEIFVVSAALCSLDFTRIDVFLGLGNIERVSCQPTFPEFLTRIIGIYTENNIDR